MSASVQVLCVNDTAKICVMFVFVHISCRFGSQRDWAVQFELTFEDLSLSWVTGWALESS